jgi:hypothetical protein
MKVSIHAEFEKDFDGFDGELVYSWDNVEDLTDVSQFLTSAVQAMGYTYVEDVGLQKKDGDVVWGGF